jgi:hypothetical protein
MGMELLMTNFEVYSPFQLQAILACLQDMERLEISIGEAVSGIRSYQDMQKAPEPAPEIKHEQQSYNGVCPSCGMLLTPVITNDRQARIIGCKKCRYSKIV